MSRFLSSKHKTLVPYTPGEQPRDQAYIKLNTNELPFPPSPIAQRLARQEAGILNLYSDPDCFVLRQSAAAYYGVDPDEIMFGNGSDDVLNYAFMAFADEKTGLLFPDVTYSFYDVLADLHNVRYETIAVRDDFSIDPKEYYGRNATIVIANPNAPSGIALSVEQIEGILKNNPDNIVIIDEAYVDFGAESCLPLIRRYDNLLIVRTFSKSGALAGGRLGFAFGCKELISDLNTIKNSMNPYCINRMTMMAGVGLLSDMDYLKDCCTRIAKIRNRTSEELRKLGFRLTDSKANFLFATLRGYDGKKLYLDLKEKGILVRYFGSERLKDYIRISIGSEEQMEQFLETVRTLVEENR